MSDRRDQQLRIAAARADFLDFGPTGGAGVTDTVAASWVRSQSAGVDPDRYRVPYDDDVDLDSRLSRSARPIIDRLTADMSGVPVTIALTDARARIVDRRDCSTAVGRVLDRIDFHRGFSFKEDGIGTNGVGTVFEVGRPVSVIGSEHFNQSLVQFACTGAPIRDPITNRIEGVLDVSMLTESWSTLIEPLVRGAAADISRNLLLDRSQATRALFEAYLRIDARSRQAVMAIGDTLMLNDRARRLLSPDEQDLIAQYARFHMTDGDRTVHIVPLDTERSIRLRTTPVVCGDPTRGVVVVLGERIERPATRSRPMSKSTQRHALIDRESGGWTLSDMRTPSWINATEKLYETMAAETPTLVMGEAGTGKLHAIQQAFAAIQGDAPTIVIDGHTPDFALCLSEMRDNTKAERGAGLFVIRHLEEGAPQSVERLLPVIDAARHAGYVLAATMSSTATDPPSDAASLLNVFDECVTLPH